MAPLCRIAVLPSVFSPFPRLAAAWPLERRRRFSKIDHASRKNSLPLDSFRPRGFWSGVHASTHGDSSSRLIPPHPSAVYGFLFLGELEAWWIPYAFGASAERVARYRALFSATHSFLPARHGITPNSLHVVLHASTLATLILICAI